MCEFCHKHGEGKKWYLRAENYAEDLLSDVRRREFIRSFLSGPERLREDLANLEKMDRAPAFIRGPLSGRSRAARSGSTTVRWCRSRTSSASSIW